jgi:hypothetical protein
MSKDPRYRNVKALVQSKSVKTLDEIFIKDMHKKSVVAADLKLSTPRWDKKMEDVTQFRISEIVKLSQLFELELIEMLELIANQYAIQQKRKTK